MFWFSLAYAVPFVAAPPTGLVVHEWGTFTAVADERGDPIRWRPLAGPSDLPSFVYRAGGPDEGIRDLPSGKQWAAQVRMETPVVYFYSPVPRVVQVAVTFPEGAITEWYPRARSADGPTLDWGTIQIRPPPDEALPHDGTASHYYPAREVDAATVAVCSPRGDEVERFLFYRGIGDFPLTVRPTVDQGTVQLRTEGRAPARVMVYERRGDAVGFTVTAPSGAVPRPVLDDSLAAVRSTLREELVAAGLYPREADAMLTTWDGDWFEDGLRVLYLLPPAETDDVLRLTVSPAPEELVRVLVGRIEVPTPEALDELRSLLASPASDERVLARVEGRFGRFAEPWLRRVHDPRADRLLPSEADGTAVD